MFTNPNYVLKRRHKYVNEGWWDLGHHTSNGVWAYLQGGPDLQAGTDLDWGLALTWLCVPIVFGKDNFATKTQFLTH